MKKRCEQRITLPPQLSGTFSGLTYLGSVEIKRSLTLLDSNGRNKVIGAGIKKILTRYGRTNYHHHQDERLEHAFVGLSPMSNYNNRGCVVKVSLSYELKFEFVFVDY